MTDISMIAQLREFGFTESEAKVYVALLEGGAVSGYEASKLSGVARSLQAYRVCFKLHDQLCDQPPRQDLNLYLKSVKTSVQPNR